MHEALAFLSCSTTLCFFGGKMPAWVKNIFTECMDGSSDWWEVWMVSSNAQQRHFDPRHWWSADDDQQQMIIACMDAEYLISEMMFGMTLSELWQSDLQIGERHCIDGLAPPRSSTRRHQRVFVAGKSRLHMFPSRQTLTDWWEKDRHSRCQQMIAAATGEWSTRPHFVSSCKKHCLLERCRVGALCLQRCYWRQTILSKILLGINFVFWIKVQDLILDIWLNPCACVCISVCVLTDQNIAVQALTWSCPIFGIWLIPCEVVAK